mmetsp:Transcript_42646/g.103147  ORF Transcript_42646/g.103147 Transcript_42646/m.103147 type:complete len:413 (-) Transcript_42646:30-1268(-)
MTTMMNQMISSSILFFLFTISGSDAQDPIDISTPPSSVPPSLLPSTSASPTLFLRQNPTPAPTTSSLGPDPIDLSTPPSSVATSTSPTLFLRQNPTPAPTPTTTTNKPTTFNSNAPVVFPTSPPTLEECANTPEFTVDYSEYSYCTYTIVSRSCDDDRVQCWDWGNLGMASENCCKCKSQCKSQCKPIPTAAPSSDSNWGCYGGNGYYNDDYYNDDTDSKIPMIFVFLGFFGMAVCARIWYNNQGSRPARREVQQTMVARRQQQRENHTSDQGLTEEERNHARYEQFVTKFYFQTVLPDKSNTTADSLRNPPAYNADAEHPSAAAAAHNHDDDDASAVGGKHSGDLSDRLSSWRRPSAKDECCICLECYAVGETICAPITTECNHVFHEGCINEWLKKNDMCPLCRVELLNH